MPKYKVGDIAALFPKPAVPKTETDKKLQSLFEQFHSKPKAKKAAQTSIEQVKSKNKRGKFIEKNSPSELKKKKRKFQDESDSSAFSISVSKKQRLEKRVNQPKGELSITHKSISNAEIYFPRNKFPKKKDTDKFADIISDNDVTDDEELFKEADDELHLQQFKTKKAKKKEKAFVEEKINEVVESSDHKLKDKKKRKAVDKNLSNNDVTISNNESLHDSLKSIQNKKMKKLKKQKEQNDRTKSQSVELQNSQILDSQTTKKIKKEKTQKLKISSSNSLLKSYNDVDKKSSNLLEVSDDQRKLKKIKKKMEKQNKSDNTETNTTLFVGNLPVTMTRANLKKLFIPFGEVKNCRVRGIVPNKANLPLKVAEIKNKFHPRLQSLVGYVVFQNGKEAVEALSLNGTLIEDHHIVVNFAAASGEKTLYDDKRTVFVGNLPFDVTNEALWSAFAHCGDIEAVRVIRDRATGAGKGFAYVLFRNIESKNKALSTKSFEISGRQARVKAIEVKGKKEHSNSSNAFNALRRQEKSKFKNKTRPKSLKKLVKKRKMSLEKKKVVGVFQRLNTFGKSKK